MCNQGAIFSLDALERPSDNEFVLVSAAEDRSIAIWTGRGDLISIPPRAWNLVAHLKAGSLTTAPIFYARIWKIIVGLWGFAAVGEDCRIAVYSWHVLDKPRVIEGHHRGQNIWSAAASTKDYPSQHNYSILATGGNDGAISICDLSVEPHYPRTIVLESPTLPDPLPPDVSPLIQQNLKNDFPRDIFFNSTGRLFYLTNNGHFFTVDWQFKERIPRYISPHSHHSNKSDLSVITTSSTSPCTGRSCCATNIFHSLLVTGDDSGTLALYHLLEDEPFLLCMDILHTDAIIMNLNWITPRKVVVGIQGSASPKFNQPATKLLLPSTTFNLWIQTAVVADRNTLASNQLQLVVGTRCGGLATFRVPSSCQDRSVSPCFTLPKCHGRGGCTSLVIVPRRGDNDNLLLSSGRTFGEIRRWLLLHSTGELVNFGVVRRSPYLSWVDRFDVRLDGSLLALGFHSTTFKAYRLQGPTITDPSSASLAFDQLASAEQCLFEADCSGGNRLWRWWSTGDQSAFINRAVLVKNNSSIARYLAVRRSRKPAITTCCMASLNRGKVVLHVGKVSSGTDKTCNRLKPSIHGTDINCCLLFSHLSSEPLDGKSLIFHCITGSEDTSLGSWTLSIPLHGKVLGNPKLSNVQHHRGHISSVRCLALPVELSREEGWTTSHNTKFLFSGSGRGQFSLWRMDLTSAGSDWQPAWLGSTRIGHSQHPNIRHSCPDNSENLVDEQQLGAVNSTSNQCDMRIMALLVVTLPVDASQQNRYLAFCACSDGSIRLLLVQPSTTRFPKITHYGSLCQLDKHSNSLSQSRFCLLDLQLLAWCPKKHSLTLLTCNTFGRIDAWRVILNPTLSESQPIIGAQLVWQVTSECTIDTSSLTSIKSSPAINCLCCLDASIFVAGLDDGSLSLGSGPLTGTDARWISTNHLEHYAAVIRLDALSFSANNSVRRLVSLSADQRIVLWRVDASSDVNTRLVPLQCMMLPGGIGDPHCLTLARQLPSLDKEEEEGQQFDSRNWLLVVGTGKQLIQI